MQFGKSRQLNISCRYSFSFVIVDRLCLKLCWFGVSVGYTIGARFPYISFSSGFDTAESRLMGL